MLFHRFLVPALLAAFAAQALLAPVATGGPTHEVAAAFEAAINTPHGDRLAAGPDGYLWGTTAFGGSFGSGVIYRIRPNGTGCEVKHSFFLVGGGSANPSGLEPDGQGYLWGTSPVGGAGAGLIFKIHASTGAYAVVRNIASPGVGLTNDGAGFLWGTTAGGGTNNASTIFKVNAVTGDYTQVASFSGSGPGNNGRSPRGRLVSDGAGHFWGTTNTGGTSNLGTVFRVNASTGALSIVANFTGNGETAKGAHPLGGLARDAQGNMWGTTSAGGAGDFGTIFKVNVVSGEITTMVEFTNNGATNKGRVPAAALFADQGARIWGTTEFGGSNDTGTVFRVDASTGELTTLVECPGATDRTAGRAPAASLIASDDGHLYGTMPNGGAKDFGTVYRVSLQSSDVATVFSFQELHPDLLGRFPLGGLVNAGNGWLWGTTEAGGKMGYGTVFKMNPVSGEAMTVVDFTGEGEFVARGPRGVLVADEHGFLWGTSLAGGATNRGTIFKVHIATGEVATIASFEPAGAGTLGANPHAGLAPDGTGHLWGTTYAGGDFDHGTIFRVNAVSGMVTKVHDFAKDGALNPGNRPRTSLCADGLGYLWGTTVEGGAGNHGTLFKIYVATGAFTHVLSFTDNGATNKGRSPRGALIRDSAGFLWGTTYSGGASNLGTVFKVHAATGALTTVSALAVPVGNGPKNPAAPVVMDEAGDLWGTTSSTTSGGDGSVFKVNAATGATTLVFGFSEFLGTGRHPSYGGLCRFDDGNLYGMVTEGGPLGAGTVFRMRFGPTPVTKDAEAITSISATLRGTVAQNGNASTATFEWGTSPALAGSQIIQATLTGTVAAPASDASASLSNLAPATTYYYRLIAENAENPIPQQGQILSFTTSPNAGPVITLNGSSPLTVEAAGSYADAGATASDVEDGTLVPVMTANTVLAHVPGQYSVKWTATDSHGASATATRDVIVEDTTPPSLEGEFAPLRVVVGTSLADYRLQALASDVVGVTELTQEPPPATPLAIGVTEVTLTAKDAAGNEAQLAFTVVVRPMDVEMESIASSGASVPGAGADPRIAEGSKWIDFGTPAVSDSGAVTFIGRWTGNAPGAQTGTGLFLGHALLAKAGESVPGAGASGLPADTVFKSFRDPVVSGDALAFVATLAGMGISTASDTAVFSTAQDGTLRMIARERDAAPESDGALFASFANVSIQAGGSSAGTLFVATLRAAKGGSRVNAANDLGVWWQAGASPPRKLVREGDPGFLPGEVIHSIQLLQATIGSTGHGRGHLGDGIALFRLITKTGAVFADRLVLGTPDSLMEVAKNGGPLNSAGIPGAKWHAFTLPSAANDGVNAAVLATLAPHGATIVKSNAKAIFGTGDLGQSWEPIARANDAAPGFPDAARFSQLFPPVHSRTGAAVAFMGTAKGRGIAGNANDGIWWKVGAHPAELLAREGDRPPNTAAGTKWKAFSSIAFPGGGAGPLFVATLAPGGPAGPDRVTAKNDRALYAMDSFGTLRELLREGQLLDGKSIKSFTVLTAALGSAGVSRSFNSAGNVTVLTSFGDGSKAIISVTIP